VGVYAHDAIVAHPHPDWPSASHPPHKGSTRGRDKNEMRPGAAINRDVQIGQGGRDERPRLRYRGGL
jgi:hypothetical protein